MIKHKKHIENGKQFRDAIIYLINMELPQFLFVWGENGKYLYDKLHNDFDRDYTDFICYLDSGNIERLFSKMVNHE